MNDVERDTILAGLALLKLFLQNKVYAPEPLSVIVDDAIWDLRTASIDFDDPEDLRTPLDVDEITELIGQLLQLALDKCQPLVV